MIKNSSIKSSFQVNLDNRVFLILFTGGNVKNRSLLFYIFLFSNWFAFFVQSNAVTSCNEPFFATCEYAQSHSKAEWTEGFLSLGQEEQKQIQEFVAAGLVFCKVSKLNLDKAWKRNPKNRFMIKEIGSLLFAKKLLAENKIYNIFKSFQMNSSDFVWILTDMFRFFRPAKRTHPLFVLFGDYRLRPFKPSIRERLNALKFRSKILNQYLNLLKSLD